MGFKISGFGGFGTDKKEALPVPSTKQESITPRKSVVQVRFPGKGMSLAYYNDQFDLKIGDLVYVDGKLEGQLGRVTEITYNFKIKIFRVQEGYCCMRYQCQRPVLYGRLPLRHLRSYHTACKQGLYVVQGSCQGRR